MISDANRAKRSWKYQLWTLGIAIAAAELTVLAAKPQGISATTLTVIYLFITLAYWRILLMFLYIYFNFRARMARLRAKRTSEPPKGSKD